MIRVLLSYALLVLRVLPALFRSQSEQAIVELVLRQQLATYADKGARPRLSPLDRTFWVALSRMWPQWKAALVIVKPETVVRWHQRGFRLYWRSSTTTTRTESTPASATRHWEDRPSLDRLLWLESSERRGLVDFIIATGGEKQHDPYVQSCEQTKSGPADEF